MSEQQPKIRANWTKMMVDAYGRTLPADVVARGMAKVDPRYLAALEDSGPFDWLDAEIHLAILEGPFDLLAAEDFHESWRHHVSQSFERPIFRGLIQGALRLFAKTPLSLMAVVPNGWSLVSRNVGVFVVDTSPDSPQGRVRLTELPPRYAGSVAFATAWAGALDSFIDLAGVEGRVDLDLSSVARGQFAYHVRWSAKAARA